MFLFLDTLSIDCELDSDAQDNFLQLYIMVNAVRGIECTFFEKMMSLSYADLSCIQQDIHNQVIKIIPHIQTSDVLVRSLFNNSCTKFHKSSHADIIEIIGHELVRLKSGDVVESLTEVHKEKLLAHEGCKHKIKYTTKLKSINKRQPAFLANIIHVSRGVVHEWYTPSTPIFVAIHPLAMPFL